MTTFAKVLNGWSIGGRQGFLAGGTAGEFYFRERLHEPGPKTVLGKTYLEQGIEQGQAVLEDLARHPSTARFLTTKLVRHFIADDPPAECVERVAAAYRKSEGHLPSTYAALIGCDAGWSEQAAKFKTPQDFVYSVYRGLDLPLPKRPRAVLAAFELAGGGTGVPPAPGRPGSQCREQRIQAL